LSQWDSDVNKACSVKAKTKAKTSAGKTQAKTSTDKVKTQAKGQGFKNLVLRPDQGQGQGQGQSLNFFEKNNDRYAQAVEGQSCTFAPIGIFSPK